MAKYRKKPVEIEARLYTGDNWVEIAKWLRESDVRIGQTTTKEASIPTLEGTMYASPGDYIIRGVQGEFYPCKPDIFEQTYEKVSGEERDEREAIINALLEELGWEWDEVPEEHIPSSKAILGDMADRVLAVSASFCRTVQAEPTDAQLDAALKASKRFVGRTQRDAMRAALRAASSVQGENRG